MNGGPTWKVWLVFAGVFLAGGVAGGFISLRVADHLVERGRGSAQYAPRLLEHFSSRLDLTEAQRAQVKVMVEAKWQEMQELRRASRDTMGDLHEEINLILTEEQKVRFEKLQADQQKRWQGMGERRGDGKGRRDGPPPPHGRDRQPPPPAPEE